MIAITAGEPYAAFNQTQCTVTFELTNFNVFVNNTQRSIDVTLIPQSIPNPELEPTDRLTSDVIWSLNLLSRMTPSLYESTLGNTLQQNAATMWARRDVYHSESVPTNDEDLILRSVEDSFTAMIDNILVAFSASQLILAQSSTPEAITAELPALQIGKKSYLMWVLALNLILLACVLEEAWRTDRWKNLPDFNFLDVRDLLLGTDLEKPESGDKRGIFVRMRELRDWRRGVDE